MTSTEGLLLALTIFSVFLTIGVTIHLESSIVNLKEDQDRHFSILSTQIGYLKTAHSNIHISTYEKLANTKLKAVDSSFVYFHDGVILSEEELARHVVDLLSKKGKK